MNKEAILELRDFIAKGEYSFNMRNPFANLDCGSAGCIGGHAAVIWPEIRQSEEMTSYTWHNEKLAAKLGISEAAHNQLCFPRKPENYSYITREHAVTTLTKLAETGRVDWSHARA